MANSRLFGIASDGYCQQGGIKTGSVSIAAGSEANIGAITFKKPYKDTNYTAISQTQSVYCLPFKVTKTTTNVTFAFGAYEIARTLTAFNWTCSGYISF